jgi:hypothetical protein
MFKNGKSLLKSAKNVKMSRDTLVNPSFPLVLFGATVAINPIPLVFLLKIDQS